MNAGKQVLYIAVVLVLLIVVAAQRHPVGKISGNSIHPPSQWNQADPRKIRVSTFNIHRGKNRDGIRNLPSIARTLKDDDISGLQEVYGAFWPGGADQAKQIAQLLNMGWLFNPTQNRFFRGYTGDALLSRIPVHTWESTPLPRTGEGTIYKKSRRFSNLLSATVTIDGKEVTLFVTHLDPGGIHTPQLEFVLEKFRGTKHAILMGDLNMTSQSLVLGEWLENHPESNAINRALGSKDHPDRVDWILVHGFDVLHGGFQDNGTSDHPYFWVLLSISQ